MAAVVMAAGYAFIVNGVGHHLGATLSRAARREEASPDPADDEHLVVDVEVGGAGRRSEPRHGHAVGPLGLTRDGELERDQLVARWQYPQFGRPGQAADGYNDIHDSP